MHEPLLAQAALPAPTVCLGMLLRPYSIGHEVLLIRDESPFVTGSRRPVLADLISAVIICCHTWEEQKSLHQDLLLSLKMWLWRRRLRKLILPLELTAFAAYRADGCLEMPISDIARPDRGPTPRAPGSPFLLRLQQWLMIHFGLRESAAWDYPLGLATMRWACHWEQEGGIDVRNAHDDEFDQFVAEMEAKTKEEVCRA